MDEVKVIVNDIKKGIIKPIYFLMGEEVYYIDKLAEFFENNILQEEERGFNQMVLYGGDITVDDIVSNAKRYPMMAERQLVIVKEAQQLSKTIEKLAGYAANPQPTTVLVICYKHKKGLDKRKALYKTIKKSGQIFESKKLYENQVGDWIRRVLKGYNFTITPKATVMLVEYLGTDLGKISNELDKLKLVLEAGSEITPAVIEENIGISKDFNNFELKKAIGERNVIKATQIIKYFEQNPRDNPIVVTVSLIFTFFSQLLKYHGLTDHSQRNVAQKLGVNPYFVSEFQIAAKNYSMKRVSGIISSIRVIDLKSKGVDANATPQGDLLKELLVKIMY